MHIQPEMNRFKEQYDNHGFAAMLKDVHAYCTMRSNEPIIPYRYIHNELIIFVTKLCLRLCRVEPVMVIISDAYNAIEKASQEIYPSMASIMFHYQTLLDIYVPRLLDSTRNESEFIIARTLILCFAHCTFECSHNPENPLDLFAEEAVRQYEGAESLLQVYHETWNPNNILVTVL